jgi:myo-inositol-1-phosphate synthase
MREAEEEAQELIQNFNAGAAKNDDTDRSIKSEFDLKNQLGNIMNKKVQRRRYNVQLESLMSEIRFVHVLNNLNTEDVINYDDPYFTNAKPSTHAFLKQFEADMPAEMRKMWNKAAFPDL